MNVQLPVLGLLCCAPNILRFGSFLVTFGCLSGLQRHCRSVDLGWEPMEKSVWGIFAALHKKPGVRCFSAPGYCCKRESSALMDPTAALFSYMSSQQRSCHKGLRQPCWWVKGEMLGLAHWLGAEQSVKPRNPETNKKRPEKVTSGRSGQSQGRWNCNGWGPTQKRKGVKNWKVVRELYSSIFASD